MQTTILRVGGEVGVMIYDRITTRLLEHVVGVILFLSSRRK